MRIEQARSRLQIANQQLSGAQEALRQLSDYEREIIQGGQPRYAPAEALVYTANGPNDRVMAPKQNLLSDTFNRAVNSVMDRLGYNTTRRPLTEDNDFYRDYAQYMPGYNINGIPSGAWAQNAATNYVGHGTGLGNPWDNIRTELVSQERAMIDADLAAGGSGKLSFWDLYTAHDNAYDMSGGGGNGFIDPGSFAVAVYGVPILEAVGINSGPVTGASIDIFNNPEDSATEGWAKRMGVAGVETGAGLAMMLSSMNPVATLAGTGSIATGGALLARGETSAGLALMLTGSPAGRVAMGGATVGLGALGAVWNTASAIDQGMIGEWGETIQRWIF